MKNYAMLLVPLLWAVVATAQTAGDYRTYQAGNWSNVNVWERFNGGTWENPAPAAPGVSDGVITILGGHLITVDAGTVVDQVIVSTGGSVVVSVGQTLTIADGADSVDMVVSGTLDNFGTVTATGRISFENGGLFVHSVPAGGTTMPSCTWRAGSTCRIDSSTGSSPTNLNTHSFYNLIWNATRQGANGGPNFNDGAIIRGDLTVTSSNSTQFRLTNLSAGQTKTVSVRGNVYVNGATALLTSTGSGADTAARAVIIIDGNVDVTAGQWSLLNSSNAYAEWKVKGNVSITGGTMQSGTSGTYLRRTLNFAGGVTQSFSLTAPGIIGTAATTFKVSNGSTVQLNFPMTLASGGALHFEHGRWKTTGVNLLTIPATGTLIGGNDSSYIDGPLAIVVASTSPTTKAFPLGSGITYRPVTLTVNHEQATATTYTALVSNTAPPLRTLPGTLSAVSSIRYYAINKSAGATISPTLGASVQLYYGLDDGVPDATLSRIAKDDGSGNWLNIGGSGTTDTTGSITSNAFFSFSDFVLATADTSAVAVLPTVTSSAASDISTTFATSGGNVTNDGGGAVVERGVCWNTSGNPAIVDPGTTDGTGAGAFTSLMTGLNPGETYYVRAYATNSAGTGYGNEVTFTTLAVLSVPTVTTSTITNILTTTATGGGNVTAWGGDPVTERGICWNTTGAPTIADSKKKSGNGLGSYVSVLAGLQPNTPYYVRAYAINGVGTGYGNEVTFTTQVPAPPVYKIVATDGSGDYTTVQAAFNAVPTNYTGRYTIFVKQGVYYEKLLLAAGKINVVLIGEDRDSTILTYDDYSGRVRDSIVIGTSTSYSVAIDASDFVARNITFRNTSTVAQAVALRTNGDRQAYYDCNILGYQDTYYTWGGSGTHRIYNKNCLIRGSVDFIFGRDIALFDSCTINVNRNGGTLTAANTDVPAKFGYVFRDCAITADAIGFDGVPITNFYLGRPWQASPRTVFIRTYEPATLNSAGWLAWNVSPALYAEYQCYGPGYNPSQRVPWSSQLADSAAALYTMQNIFAMDAFEPQFGFDWVPPAPPPLSPVSHLTLNAESLNVGNVIVNSSVTDTVLLMSAGDVALVVDSVRVYGGEFLATPLGPIIVQVGGSLNIHVSFSPTAAGQQTGSMVIFSNAPSSPDTVFLAGTGLNSTLVVDVPVPAGWGLKSNPVVTLEDSVRQLFPSSLYDHSYSFTMAAGYQQQHRMLNGTGYWVKFPSADTVQVPGTIILEDTIPVGTGWNIIGSLSIPLDTAEIVWSPPDNRTSVYQSYDNGYAADSRIIPGKAYWVKARTGGYLVLSAIGSPPRIVVEKPVESISTFKIADAAGASQMLYIRTGDSETPLTMFELPPQAPEGAFHVRFESNRMMEETPAVGESHFAILLSSVVYPVTLSWELASPDQVCSLSGDNMPDRSITGSGEMILEDPAIRRIVIGTQTVGHPAVFDLLQNYPNPFNPVTQIRFSVAVEAPTRLTVFNLLGQEVATLFHDNARSGQFYDVTLDAASLASGVYFYQLRSGSMSMVKKLMVVK